MATIAREVPPPLLSAAGGHVNGAMAAEEGRRPAAVPQAGAIAATESATAHNLGVSFRLYRETVPASSLLPSSPLMSAGVPLVAAMNNNLENHGHGGKVMAAAVLGNKATGGAVLRDKSNLPQISRTNAPGKPLLSLGGVVPTAIGRTSVPDDLGKTGTVGRPRGTSQATSASSQPQLKSFFSRMIVTNKARQELAAVERGRRAADVAGDAVKNTAAETEAGAADKLSSGGIALPVTTAPSFVPNLNQLPLLEDVPTYKLNSVHDAFLSPGEQPLVPLQDAELFSARDDEFGVLQPPRTCLSQFDNGLEDWDDGFARFGMLSGRPHFTIHLDVLTSSPLFTDVDRVADVDADYANNHLYCVEYVAEIFEHLLELEVKRRPAPNYLMKQREITAEMRAMYAVVVVVVVPVPLNESSAHERNMLVIHPPAQPH